MARVEIEDFSVPDEVRRPENTTVEVVKLGRGEIGRNTFSRAGAGPSTSSPSSAPSHARRTTSATPCPGLWSSTATTAAAVRSPQRGCAGSPPATTPGSLATTPRRSRIPRRGAYAKH